MHYIAISEIGLDFERAVVPDFDICHFSSSGGGRSYLAVLGVLGWQILPFDIIAGLFFIESVQRIGTSVGAAYQPVFDIGSQFSSYHSYWHGIIDVAKVYGEWHYLG